MDAYKCISCGKRISIDLKSVKKIICPFCGYRILEKVRISVAKKVMAR